ncbi:MAG TPA: endonuclease/exonuclease/phosphatase family protein [Holophagaceae bacterium]
MKSGRLAALGLLATLLACGGGSNPHPGVTPAPQTSGSIPAQGGTDTLDLANWNLDWFGDPANGPVNDTLQVQNAQAVIAGADCDVWGLEEVVDAGSFHALLAGLPGYAGLLASDPGVSQGASFYGPTEQKVALIYKTALASVESAQVILTDHDYDFAGRPPLEVRLQVALHGSAETFYIIVLHAKAGSDSASCQRRANAAAALKAYLDTTRAQDRVVVMGDFNDDLDTSITAGQPSPYQAFVTDTARYFTPTKALSAAGQTTYLSRFNSTDPIDHQIVPAAWLGRYLAGSAEAFHADQYVGSYTSTTSDHRPVITRWTGF